MPRLNTASTDRSEFSEDGLWYPDILPADSPDAWDTVYDLDVLWSLAFGICSGNNVIILICELNIFITLVIFRALEHLEVHSKLHSNPTPYCFL